ncbi:peptidase C14 [Rhizoctonia solani]|uniref:Peptidase C14 n=1 Tax=Rhizoctonia solani TaxID=456999 RepID=A0A8H8T009_9AGAM|nr:peptidase C14 [Rhizoctonia solani]QRW23157.1 peptidase C14 [Rhizoctonia solani]
MPFMITLRESLVRIEDKWKKRLRMDGSRPTATTSGPGPSQAPVAEFAPTTATSSMPMQNIAFESSAEHEAYTCLPERTSSTWIAIRALVSSLESSTEVFGPLKSAISGLKGCISMYENAGKESKEYEDLAIKLENILNDMNEHIEQPTGTRTTASVRRIYAEIEEEAKIVAEKQARATGSHLMDAMMGSDGIIECYRRIDGHLQRLGLNASMSTLKAVNEQTMESRLAKMSPTMPAIYNSAESQDLKRGSCAPGTRQVQIELLLQWAHRPEIGRTCWMNGMAGTGKTTIAYTICERLDATCELGASFFCSRSIPECRQVKFIIPSIAYQLARFSAPFRFALDKVLESDPDAHMRTLKTQYEKLIVGPLQEVQRCLPTHFIVVIDALDECENEDSVGQILDLLLSTAHNLPVRYLVSSRPERTITQRMAEFGDGKEDVRLVLHDLSSDSVKADIETYMRYELRHVPLTDAQWLAVISSCEVLFIYASTTCRYLKQAHETKTLAEVINAITNPTHGSMEYQGDNAIDELYTTILDAAFNKSGFNKANKKRMKNILETVICAIKPITLDAIADLTGLESGEQADALLKPLRSVLNVATETGLVNSLHASFPDFILSPERSGLYHCQPNIRHARMAKTCLRLIDAIEPKFNICDLPSSYLLDAEVNGLHRRVAQSISLGLMYACRYWSAHLSLGEYQNGLVELVHGFFSSCLLLWIEIINLTKNMRSGTAIIQDAEKWCNEKGVPQEVTQLAHDASQFISIYANHPVSQSTPHIYVSMLPFWPRSRPLSAAYMPRTSGLVRPTGTAIDRRRLALIATWKVSTENVQSISLSRDGRRLVAPTADSIDVYDTTTGDIALSLTEERTKYIDYVAISPDGSKVAFSSRGDTSYMWDTAKGGTVTRLLPDGVFGGRSLSFSPDGSRVACGLKTGEVYICVLGQAVNIHGPLTGHTTYVTSVVFSSDGLRLASASNDKTIQLWNVQTGRPVGTPFEGHTAEVWSLCFCPTDSRIASGSRDKTIRVWDPQTGQTVLGPLTGHSSAVYCVAFSHNGSFIASGSSDITIRVYETCTGQTVLGPLKGHTKYINSVIFSPDSTRLFSCSADGTVRVWNVQDINTSNPLPTTPSLSSHIYSIRYSHNGTRVVSGSADGSIHVWDVATGQLVLGPLHGHEDVVISLDYSSDDQYIASGSEDNTLRVWDGLTGQDMHGPIKGHSGDVKCVRFSPDSMVVVSGSSDHTVRIWDVNTGQQVTQLFQGHSSIRSVAISPDGQRVACGSDDGKIVVLDRHSGIPLVDPIDAHKDWIRLVEFSPDGMRLVSGSDDLSVGIWDAETGKQLVVCGGSDGAHSDYVLSVSFSPNGLYVASGSRDRTVRVWDSQNGKPIRGPLTGHTDWVNCVQFSPDDSHLVSCSRDCSIRLWDVSPLGIHSQENSMRDPAHARAADPIDLWSLNSDGWVVDSRGRRLVWVPSDLCTYLALPPTNSIIADQGYFRLETDEWKIGDEWVRCYSA